MPHIWKMVAAGAIAIVAATFHAGPSPAQAPAQADELKAFQERVRTLRQAGKTAEGLAEAQKYVEAAKNRVGEKDPEYAVAVSWLAEFTRLQGRYAEAEALHKKALATIEAALGPEHQRVASYLLDLASVYEAQTRYTEAEQLYKRALEITEKSRGPEHPDVARRLANLGLLYDRLNRPAEAVPLLERALAITEKARGPEHLDVAVQLRNLAYVYRGPKERQADAETLYKRSLAITEKAVGPEDIRLASPLVALADLYRMLRRYDEAEPLYKRALAITEKALGPNHIDVANRLNSLGILYSAQRRFAESLPLGVRALEITEKALGPEHPRLGPLLYNLAHRYEKLGRYQEAEKLLKRAIALGEKTFGPNHAALATRVGELARIYEIQGRPAEAEPLYRRALAINEKVFGTEHPLAAMSRLVLGGFYKSTGRRSEAEPLLKSALANIEKSVGPNHPMLAYILTQLGDLYRLQGQCEQAEPLFVRALAISKEDLKEVAVLFGTDRKADGSRSSVSFTGERGSALSLGLAVVTMPRPELDNPNMEPAVEHKDGPAGEPESARRLALRCIQIVKDKQLIETAARRLTVSTAFPNQAFVFVHGYNVSFDNAVRRAAQIAYDLKFDGGAFLFSWPSQGRFDIRAYFSDRETVDIAAEHLRLFLETVVAETKAAKIHFVAHSMGNLVLLQALEKISNQSPALRNAIGEIIQAAPDVDADVFAGAVERLKARGANMTLYASRIDKALWFSGWLRNGARAGFISKDKPLIVRGVDTIDITGAGIGLFGLNHDVYLASPSIVADMRRIFETGERPPDKRTKELEPVVSKAGTYWRLRAR